MEKNLFEDRVQQLSSQLTTELVEKITVAFEVKYKPALKVQSYESIFIQEILDAVVNTNSVNALLVSKKLIIIGTILSNWRELTSSTGCSALRLEYNTYLKRMYILTSTSNAQLLENMDIFWKELAIARLQVFPVHSGIVEFYSGFGAREGLSINLLKSLSFICIICKLGRKPYYRTHLHTPLLPLFSPESWVKGYLQIAEMLKCDKTIKGLVRTSWYFDPEIKKISPHLSYLQEIPLQNGALRFCVGKDHSGCALAKSKSRLELFNKGEYVPRNYLLVWPREAIIYWFENYREK